jgi:diguanylate cyclase (GGDEF)-like protein
VSLLTVDVDHFKSFNDNHGHDAGDTVLRNVGEIMRSLFIDDAVPCRFGGEEFVVMLPGTCLGDAAVRAEELRARIEALTIRYADGHLPRVTISAGVAAFPEAGGNLMDILKVADDALYRAKQNGRNRVETSDRAMTDLQVGKAADEAVAALDSVLSQAGRKGDAVEPSERKRRSNAA